VEPLQDPPRGTQEAQFHDKGDAVECEKNKGIKSGGDVTHWSQHQTTRRADSQKHSADPQISFVLALVKSGTKMGKGKRGVGKGTTVEHGGKRADSKNEKPGRMSCDGRSRRSTGRTLIAGAVKRSEPKKAIVAWGVTNEGEVGPCTKIPVTGKKKPMKKREEAIH